jgi:hypothetical protein
MISKKLVNMRRKEKKTAAHPKILDQEGLDYLDRIKPLVQEASLWRDGLNKLASFGSVEQSLAESKIITDNCYSLVGKISSVPTPDDTSLIKEHFIVAATYLAWAANAAHDMIAFRSNTEKLNIVASFITYTMAQSEIEFNLAVQERNKFLCQFSPTLN